MKRLNFSLPRKKLLLYGIPLVFVGVIGGTILTLSIPHSKAEVTLYQSGAQSDTNVPIDPNAQGHATLTVHTDPPTQTPTSAPVVQSSPTAIPADPAQPQPTTAPCK